MRNVIKAVIERGSYDLTGMLANIDRYHVEGKLTDDERAELYALARRKPMAQYDYAVEIEKLWAAIRELQQQGAGGDSAPADEYPAYAQPTGAHDAYNVGDGVTYNGKKYRCVMANCVWSPDVLPAAWEFVG